MIFARNYPILAKPNKVYKRGRPSEPYQLAKKYSSRQVISAAKKKDLVGLCKNFCTYSGIYICEIFMV
jgi:hypothetical protein